jgi:hypothetical protein
MTKPEFNLAEADQPKVAASHADSADPLATPQTLSIATFCARNGIGLTLYHRLKNEGRGPREMRLGRTIRITLEAERDWQREREWPSDAEARLIAREHKARVGLSRRAGKIAAASPKHISRRTARNGKVV